METTLDLKTIAESLTSSAHAISDYINKNIFTIKYHEAQELNNRSQDLLIKSKTLYELSAIEMAEEGKSALDSLKQATAEITHSIRTIKTVQQIIDLSSKLVLLAGYLIPPNVNPSGVLSTVRDILNSF